MPRTCTLSNILFSLSRIATLYTLVASLLVWCGVIVNSTVELVYIVLATDDICNLCILGYTWCGVVYLSIWLDFLTSALLLIYALVVKVRVTTVNQVFSCLEIIIWTIVAICLCVQGLLSVFGDLESMLKYDLPILTSFGMSFLLVNWTFICALRIISLLSCFKHRLYSDNPGDWEKELGFTKYETSVLSLLSLLQVACLCFVFFYYGNITLGVGFSILSACFIIICGLQLRWPVWPTIFVWIIGVFFTICSFYANVIMGFIVVVSILLLRGFLFPSYRPKLIGLSYYLQYNALPPAAADDGKAHEPLMAMGDWDDGDDEDNGGNGEDGGNPPIMVNRADGGCCSTIQSNGRRVLSGLHYICNVFDISKIGWIALHFLLTLTVVLLVYSLYSIKTENIDSQTTLSLTVGPAPVPVFAPEVCSLRWTFNNSDDEYNIVDMAYFAALAYETNGTRIQEFVDQLFPNNTFVIHLPNPDQAVTMYQAQNLVSNYSFVVIRGTQSNRDWVENIDTWQMVAILQASTLLGPFINAWPESVVQYFVKYSTLNHILKKNFHYYSPVKEFVTDLQQQSQQVMMVGHSLAGGIAKIVGSSTSSYAVSFSGPGTVYISKKLGLDVNTTSNYVTNIIPDMDIVPKIDKQEGIQARVECKAGVLNCHAIIRTLCQLIRVCGDPYRTLTANCTSYY